MSRHRIPQTHRSVFYEITHSCITHIQVAASYGCHKQTYKSIPDCYRAAETPTLATSKDSAPEQQKRC